MPVVLRPLVVRQLLDNLSDPRCVKREGTAAIVAEPLAIEANATCIECHRNAAAAMAASGGPHGELHCDMCHVEITLEEPGAVPQCLTCHQAQSAKMGDEAVRTATAAAPG